MIVTIEELRSLPRWATVAFSARCAWHVYPVAGLGTAPEYLDDVKNAIEIAERASSAGVVDRQTLQRYTANFRGRSSWRMVTAAADSARAAVRAMLDAKKPELLCWAALESAQFAEESAQCVEIAATNGNGVLANIRTNIRRDFELLAFKAKEQAWTSNTPLSSHFFALHSEFELAARTGETSLVEIVPALSAELMGRLKEHPKGMLELDPRQFEELIAKLFEGFGFVVQLTVPTHDNGRDVIAIDYHDRRKYLIECKRYREKPVGIAVVQRLNGVIHGEGATKGIIATTSRFTKPAQEFLLSENVKWRLEGRDFDGLVDWLEVYQRLRSQRQF